MRDPVGAGREEVEDVKRIDLARWTTAGESGGGEGCFTQPQAVIGSEAWRRRIGVVMIKGASWMEGRRRPYTRVFGKAQITPHASLSQAPIAQTIPCHSVGDLFHDYSFFSRTSTTTPREQTFDAQPFSAFALHGIPMCGKHCFKAGGSGIA